MSITVNLRSRREPVSNNEEPVARHAVVALEPANAALLICDVWDRHWCLSASRRCDALANNMAPVVESSRQKGIRIIHAPSDCIGRYEATIARQRVKAAPLIESPPSVPRESPPLPIDDSDGGCDDEIPCRPHIAWTRQHPAITIQDCDAISEDGREIFSLLKREGRDTLLIMGVHTNMCVLNRSFGIRQMTQWGIRCLLIRDLTDTMYNPRLRPFVPHDEGTRLMVEYIERDWCPTLLSGDLRG